MNSKTEAVLEFGEFRLDTTEQVLRRNGVVVSLSPKAVDLLELLLRRHGCVLSRGEMIEALWPDTFVEEANLTVTISMLRKALGEEGNNFIRTVPKRGYTFTAPVRDVSPAHTKVEIKFEESRTYTLISEAEADGIDEAWRLPLVDAGDAKLLPASRTRRLRWRLVAPLALLLLSLGVGGWLYRRQFANRTRTRPQAFATMQVTRLTDTGNIRDVTLSPDGNWLAYVSIEGGRESLWLKHLETDERFQLLEPQERLCWGLRFTHDGQSLYYTTTQPSSTISVLYRSNLQGGQAQKIVVNVDAPISLSPDGAQIAFVRSFPGKHYDALVVANNDGTGEHELAVLTHPQKFSFSGSAWSPDGKVIVLGVSRDNNASFNLSAVPLAGGGPQALTTQPWTTVRGVAWTDDGQSLIFAAGTTESQVSQVWQLDYPSGSLHRVTIDTNYYEGLHLAKNGSKLVTMQVAELINLWATDSSARARKLTFGTREGEGGLVSLPSGQIVYTVEENRQLNLWTINHDGSGALPLTREGAGYPTATADGQFVVYASLRNGLRHLYRLRPANGEEVQLTNGGGENYPSCSPDGQWVIYTALAGARNTLWKVSIGGGSPEQLTHGSIIVKPVVSPDGKWIACAFRKDEADKWKVAILPFAGGEPMKVLPITKAFNQILRWAPDSSALFYIVEEDGVSNIWKQPLGDTPAAQVTRFTEDTIFYYDRLASLDGFVLSRGRILRDIVLIKNPL